MDKYTIRALYIVNNNGQKFKDILSQGEFVFSDIGASMEFLSFLNTYLVKNGK